MTREEKIKQRRRQRENIFIIWTIIVALICVLFGRFSASIKGVKKEAAAERLFDTSVIEEQWCGDFAEGHIRLLGGSKYGEGAVLDETGHVWEIDVDVAETDFLLLWIADCGTPETVDDDVIVKVWKEAL